MATSFSSQQTAPGCGYQVSPNQEHASAVAGNIGIIKSKVEIWENDPLFGRMHQQNSFVFSEQTKDAVEQSAPNLEFQLRTAFLKPIYEIHDMWIATKKKVSDDDKKFKLDFLKSAAASPRMPSSQRLTTVSETDDLYELNGKADSSGKIDDTTGKDIFPHQVWIYSGSLLRRGVLVHPSEYDINIQSIDSIDQLKNSSEIISDTDRFKFVDLAEIQSSPKWDYRELTDNSKTCFTPVMVSKQVPSSANPVHWTIEKLMSIWQGQDFFITVIKGNQKTDDARDPGPDTIPEELVDTNWNEYKYLLFDPSTKPTDSLADVNWIDGISNEAFWIAPQKEGDSQVITAQDIKKSKDSARKRYWWKYQTYILIEIGTGHPDHNYFIEIVKGRNPRFLHLGEEWDNSKRLQPEDIASPDDWFKIKKCRVLSEFSEISSDELFKTDFRVKVRNHIGRIVITFEGHEGSPWVINRQDNDPTRYDYTKVTVPMVVPAGKIRIHGGNISCAINYSPTRYVSTAEAIFPDRQADTFEATDKDLYMTFANIGGALQFRNDIIHEKYFDDKRLALRPIGYDVDCYNVQEILKNTSKTIRIYEVFREFYRKTGKGWLQPDEFVVGTGFLRSSFNNGMSKKGGKPHRAIIFNAENPRKHFDLNVSAKENIQYDYKEYVGKWDVGIRLEAGSVVMPVYKGDRLTGQDRDFVEYSGVDPIDSSAKEKIFTDYVTPIISQWSYLVLAGAKPFEGKINKYDISSLVVKINDSWSAEGFTKINHTCKIRCYLPDSMLPQSGDPGREQIDSNIYNLGKKILDLHKQAFYVTVSYWWENGIGERDAPGNIIRRSGKPENSKLLIQMSGIAYGGSLEKSVNKLFMDFEVKDYTHILETQYIFNSPFFDGVTDSVAVYELARLAGFDDSYDNKTSIQRQPLSYLAKTITDRKVKEGNNFRFNGETSKYRIFDLPGSYSDLANPSIRFQNGETYLSAITKIASMSSKVFYCDRWGVLRLESAPAIEAAFSVGNAADYKPKFAFVTTPFHNTYQKTGEDDLSVQRFNFNPRLHASHLVYDVVTYQRSVEDCISQIILYSASNDILLEDGSKTGGFIVEGYTFFEQIFNPTAEGFLGYRKPFYQSNGIFGSVESIRNAMRSYAQMKYPPANVTFQTYSVPGLKALDIISLDDNLFYITEISHDLDPETNRGWCNVNAEWLKSFTGDLGFLEDKGPTDTRSLPETPPIVI